MKLPGKWIALALFAAGFTGIVCTSQAPTAREEMAQARLSEESDLEQRYQVIRRQWERIKQDTAAAPHADDQFVQMIDRRLEEAAESLESMKEAKSLQWAEHRGRVGRTLDDLSRELADAQAEAAQRKRGDRRS